MLLMTNSAASKQAACSWSFVQSDQAASNPGCSSWAMDLAAVDLTGHIPAIRQLTGLLFDEGALHQLPELPQTKHLHGSFRKAITAAG